MELTIGKTVEWYTPPEVFDPLHSEFGFTLDVCAAGPQAARLPNFLSPADNGLTLSWRPYRCWMNPPYGRAIVPWVKKAAEAATLVVGLLPARTDTAWFHDYVLGKAEIRFMRGRVRFINPLSEKRDPAPFPTLLAIWR